MTNMLDDRVFALERQNAELRRQLDVCHAELQEARAQQSAAADVLQVINSSPGDLSPVFDEIVEKAHTLCGAVCGSLQLWDGEKFRGIAMRGFPEPMVESLRQGYSPGPNHPCRELIDGERIAHCPDMAAVDDPVTRLGARLSGVRTVAYVALRKDGALLGQIVACRLEVRPFTDAELALLENFAAQAVIAMENARLLTETREALEQQTATAEVLQVINSSPGDLAPVFDAMLEKALSLCEATYGHLVTFDGEFIHIEALTGDRRLVDHFRRIGPVRPPPHSVIERMLEGEDVVHIQDTAADEGSRVVRSLLQALADIGGTRSLLGVALHKDRTLVGAIVVYRQEMRPFTDKQIALLQNFAAQAVIAMENARLINETREALEQQTATAEVLQVINSSPGALTPVFDAILERAHSLCAIDFGALQLQDGRKFRSVAARGLSEALVELSRQPFEPVPGSPPSRLLGGERFVHIADMAELARRGSTDARAQAVSTDGFRTGLFVPLRKDANLLGYIVALRREVRLYSEKEIALLENFAAQAVIAMENARLLTETREALEQQIATAEVLQVINRSPGDLAPVFDAILEKAHTLCSAVCGSLQLWDGEKFRGVAMRGVPEPMMETLRQGYSLGPNHPCRGLINGERIVHCIDMAGVDDPITRLGAKLSGIRTIAFVALRKDGVLFGQIAAGRLEIRPFTDAELALLENFAAQAVIAMENARLLTETREALAQQTATAEVLQVINSSLGDLTPVFDAILQKAHTLCGATLGTLALFDGETLRAAAVHGYPEGLAEELRRGIRVPPNLPLLAGARLVHYPDLRELDEPFARDLAERGGIRTNLLLPLRKDSALLGLITCNRQEVRPFTDKQIVLLENFAAQAVIAIENARLLSETREALGATDRNC